VLFDELIAGACGMMLQGISSGMDPDEASLQLTDCQLSVQQERALYSVK